MRSTHADCKLPRRHYRVLIFELVIVLLRKYVSPEQIAGKLQSMNTPCFEDVYVFHETIYSATYAPPAGERRKGMSSVWTRA